MRWERLVRNAAFAIVLFLLVQALQGLHWPGADVVRAYIAFAFTTDWDYTPAWEQAQRGIRVLATYTGRWLAPDQSTPAPGEQASTPAAAATRPPAPDMTAGEVQAERAEPAPEQPEQQTARPAEQALRWPVEGRLSEPFGPRTHPIRRLAGVHEGIDLAAPEGTPVVAAAPGRVAATFRSLSSGLTVDIAHETCTTRYAHLSAIKVEKGATVAAGQVIGLVGHTGVATGPHLHFEVRVQGRPVDPLPLLRR